MHKPAQTFQPREYLRVRTMYMYIPISLSKHRTGTVSMWKALALAWMDRMKWENLLKHRCQEPNNLFVYIDCKISWGKLWYILIHFISRGIRINRCYILKTQLVSWNFIHFIFLAKLYVERKIATDRKDENRKYRWWYYFDDTLIGNILRQK